MRKTSKCSVLENILRQSARTSVESSGEIRLLRLAFREFVITSRCDQGHADILLRDIAGRFRGMQRGDHTSALVTSRPLYDCSLTWFTWHDNSRCTFAREAFARAKYRTDKSHLLRKVMRMIRSIKKGFPSSFFFFLFLNHLCMW